jgi:elongation factor G
LFDGSFHEKDSTEQSFKIAASLALKDGTRRGDPVLLEPIMRADVVSPAEYLGDVFGDLMRRRATIVKQEPRGNAIVIHGHVPLAEMFGYIGGLRSLSQGRANYSMEPSHYEEMPRTAADQVVIERRTANQH